MVWITCVLLRCFYQLSFWRHPFTAEDPLVKLWCIFPSLFWWRNKLIYILYGLKMSKGFSKYIFFVRAIALNFACMLFSSSGSKISRANSPCYHVIKTSSCITAVWLSERFISADFFIWSRLSMYVFFVVKNDQPLTQLVCMLNKQKRGRAVLFAVFHVCCE